MKVIKKLFILIFVLFVNSAFGQEKSTIKFYEDTPWNKVVEIAQKEGKQIYVYCYTTW